VRPASLYKHVGDLAGLEALLAESAATTLGGHLDTVLAAHESDCDCDRASAAAFMAAADAYVQFARRYPARYVLLTASAPSSPDAGIARKALWNRLLTIVGTRAGDADDTGAAAAVWSLLHGFVALEQAGLFGASGPHGALARGIDALARGFSAPQA
jgi:hypothetical protein